MARTGHSRDQGSGMCGFRLQTEEELSALNSRLKPEATPSQTDFYVSNPRRAACATAAALDDTLSLLKMFARCRCTV